MKEYFEIHPFLLMLVKMLIIAVITHFIAVFSKRMWRRNPKNTQVLFRKFIFNIVQALIYLVGVLFVIGQIPELSQVVQTILAGSGIFALGLSLSAQESLNNIISGLFITIFKPFEVGDRVTLVSSKLTGTIEDITLRHTIIKTFTNTRYVIPNAKINNEIIENSNIVDARASSFLDVSITCESDVDLAMKIMADVMGSHPSYLDIRTEEEMETMPKVKVYVREFGRDGIALRANMWTRTVNENFEACSDVRLQLRKAFQEAGIEIPYTRYVIMHREEEG